MAHGLQIGLRNGGLRRGGLRAGFEGGSIFNIASLDLNFARYKNIGSLVTFTRASSGTFVGSDGVLQTAVTNLLLRSEDLTTTWTKDAGVTITADLSQGQPFPGAQVFRVNYTGVNQSGPSQNNTYLAAPYAASVWIKGTPGETIRFTGQATVAAADFTLTGNWQRLSLAWTGTATAQAFSINTFNAVTARTIYVAAPQLEQASTVGDYIPTTSTINSAPRFDHDPTTGESLGLLVEESRTNSIRNNTGVGAVAGTPGTLPTNWTIGGGGIGTLSQQVVGTGTVGSLSYIDVRYSGTTSSTGFIVAFEPSTQIAALTGQSWTSSFYVALISGSTNINLIRHNIVERTAAGGSVKQNFSDNLKSSLTSNLIRSTYSIVLSGGATIAFVQPSIEFNFASGVAIDMTLRIGLPQLEQGAFATSPILTSTAAATRSADVASITGSNFSSWYRQDEGTVFADVTVLSTSRTNQTISFNDGTANNRFELRSVGGADQMRTDCIVNGVTKYANSAFALTGQRRAGALAVKANDFRLQSGASGISPTSDAVPTVDRLYLNYATFAGGEINGTIRRLTYWPARLPNSTLQTITQ